MNQVEKKSKKLQEWMLLEAYKNGEARREGACPAGSPAADGRERYHVNRYAVYQRFFKLPIEAFFQGGDGRSSVRRSVEYRLRCSRLLCHSVRVLLREGLIWFPHRPAATGRPDESVLPGTTFIFLTAAGVRKAESLIFPRPDPAAPLNGSEQAWSPSTS
jgi:hypothetical protein